MKGQLGSSGSDVSKTAWLLADQLQMQKVLRDWAESFYLSINVFAFRSSSA